MNRNDKIYTRDSSLQEWRIIDPSLVLGDFKGDLLLDGQAKLDALTSVGGDLRLYGQAKLDASALTSVGGDLLLDGQAKLDASALKIGRAHV